MKNQLHTLLLIFFLGSTLNAFSQIPSPEINKVRTTAISNCDGSLTISNSVDFPESTYSWSWFQGGTLLQTGGATINGLCHGDYILIIENTVTSETLTTYHPLGVDCAVSSPNIVDTNIVNPIPGNDIGAIEPILGLGFAPYLWQWSNGSTASSINGLPAGIYSVTITDYYECTTDLTIELEVDSSGVTPMHVDFELADDGDPWSNSLIAYYSISGGVPPYGGQFENTCEIVSSQGGCAYSIGYLTGLQTATFHDSNGDTIVIQFLMSDSEEIYSNFPYPDSTTNNNIYLGLIENCEIDYQTIDTAYLSAVTFDTVSMQVFYTWSVITSTATYDIIDSIPFEGNAGIYTMNISAYCPQKSGNNYMTIWGQFSFDGDNFNTLEVNNDKLSDLSVFPNPFTDQVTITGLTNSDNIRVTDAFGRNVDFSQSVDQQGTQLQFDELSSGTYFILITAETEVRTIKIIR